MNIQEITELFDLSTSVDHATAALQTKTCRQVIEMLQTIPGIIIGDDVGMGKTYIAISAAMCFLDSYPNKKVIIVTPSWLLNAKWYQDIRNFIEKNLHSDRVQLRESDVIEIKQSSGTYISQIANAAKVGKIILIPINVLSSMGWKYEKGFFISCWFKHRCLQGIAREKILKALGGDVNKFDPEEFGDMGITYQDIPDSWYAEMDRIYSEEGISDDGINHIVNSLKELRYKAINKVMPESSLFILDEAHKMKNEETVKRRALEAAVNHKFEKGIFLTATPFQLGEGELRSVLELFKSATVSQKELERFNDRVEKLFIEMNNYQDKIRLFEDYVHNLSADEGIQLETVIRTGVKNNIESNVIETYDLYQRLIEQKNILESVMKRLIIRNLKKKDEYRNEVIGSLNNNDKSGIPLSNEAYVPFALFEKAIYQIMEKGEQTFIANVKHSFTSSFEAVENGSIYTKDLQAINMLKKIELGQVVHPKLNDVANEVATALMNGEKTLLFCDRIDTVNSLKISLNKRLSRSYDREVKKLFPENKTKGFDNYCRRFYNKQDISWFLLQENYIHSVLFPVMEICGINKREIPKASDIFEEVTKLYKRYNVTAKANYMYIKRIIEHIVFIKTLAKDSEWKSKLLCFPELLKTINIILGRNYIVLGLKLEKDSDEEDISDDDAKPRSISKTLIREMINYKGIWHVYHEQLNKLPAFERDQLVSSMIKFLRRDKRFFIKLRHTKEDYPDKDDSFLINKTFGRGSLLDWENAFQRFLEQYCNETAANANREEMRLGLSNSDVVATISGNTGNEARKKIKAGFNTPFYPQILIATSIMQEGIDLQVECKRVFHYDLEWNPASMEQRVGRIDRIGSLISKLRQKEKEVTLDVYYPYIKNTIDESIYNTVKEREKWFNLILGGTPQWDTFEIDPNVTNISADVFKNLQINLSVS